MWFIGVEVEQETSATPPKKNPGCIIQTNCRIPMINLAHSEFMMEWKAGKKKQI